MVKHEDCFELVAEKIISQEIIVDFELTLNIKTALYATVNFQNKSYCVI